MAGNKRGQIKEHLEGVHRNCDWSTHHLQSTLALIKDVKPKLSKAIELLAKTVKEVDDFAQSIYSKI